MTYEWDFGGQKVEGKTAGHAFATPGRHEVLLAVSLPDGQSAQARAFVDVPASLQLQWDPATGTLNAQPGTAPLTDLPLTEGEGGGRVTPTHPSNSASKRWRPRHGASSRKRNSAW